MSLSRLVAVVDDDPVQRQFLSNALDRAGLQTLCCRDSEEALAASSRCDLMLLDVRLPGVDGIRVLEQVKSAHPNLPIILLTAYGDVRDAVSAIRLGAIDYLEKPADLDELIAAVDNAIGPSETLMADVPDLQLPPGIVAESEAMRSVFQQAARAACAQVTVLLQGESGTGKEVVARFIHDLSPRAAEAFVRVDCGALPAGLIESEMFGHEKGAFTGADDRHMGRFEEAHGKTLFLDEIGELSLALQPKLLRVLESGTFRRVGGAHMLKTDVRVVAATNRNLEQEVNRGTFRTDLYFRLNVFAITVPPLRERRDDILPYAAELLKASRFRLAASTERALMNYDWPGNLRELRNALDHASIMAHGNVVLPGDLPRHIREAKPAPRPNSLLVGDMREIQRRAIIEAVMKTDGNKTQAAQLLGISRSNLSYKLREYGLQPRSEPKLL